MGSLSDPEGKAKREFKEGLGEKLFILASAKC